MKTDLFSTKVILKKVILQNSNRMLALRRSVVYERIILEYRMVKNWIAENLPSSFSCILKMQNFQLSIRYYKCRDTRCS